MRTNVQAALAQIEEKQYEMKLIAHGILMERFHIYGFAFGRKQVLIG